MGFSGTRHGGGALSWHYLLSTRKGEAMKTILSALAVVMLLGAATATPASAACWAGPEGVRCWHPYWHHWHHWHHDYDGW
jgi:hypothetical protein